MKNIWKSTLIVTTTLLFLGCGGGGATTPLKKPIAFFCWDGIANYPLALQNLQGYESPTIYLNPVDHGSDENFESNVERLQEAGSKVWYLISGDPDDDYMDAQIKRIATYNADHSHPIEGMVFDMEPWTAFSDQNSSENKEAWQTYLDMLQKNSDKLHAIGVKISAVIPFWLNTITEAFPNNRPINYDILDRVDEVVVMDYTVYEERFVAYAQDSLNYAQSVQKEVVVAMEMHDIDNDAVSFATHPEDLAPFVENNFTYTSFKGFSIHTLDDFVSSELNLSL